MKIKIIVTTDRVGSKMTRTLQVDDEDLEGMTDEQRVRYLDDRAYEEACEMISWSWEAEDE